MRFYSVVIPVYNRPDEVDELLSSLTHQTYDKFEVIIVEDGSSNDCKKIVEAYRDRMEISYYYKENTGQGFSRNFGFDKAKGDYFVVFDSDCLIPPHYFETVEHHLDAYKLDAYGGPDKDHPSFTDMQKAISYSMTSLFTTGGIRGRKKSLGTFHPRSFNMGISREVFRQTGGYLITRMGEDIEFSIRIISNGFKTGLIPEAYVYHKRRTSLKQFYRQLHFFGRARINIQRFFKSEIKLVHTFPVVFLVGFIVNFILLLIYPEIFKWTTLLIGIYFGLIFIDSTIKNKSLKIGLLSIATSFIQLSAYGVGFITEGFRRLKELLGA
ncbi:MAG: glycosyltransferase [Cyclobacteriaceae bacterium]